MGLRGVQWAIVACLTAATPSCWAGTIVVTSIGGWNAGAEVINGKWTGQPPAAPNLGKYVNFSMR